MSTSFFKKLKGKINLDLLYIVLGSSALLLFTVLFSLSQQVPCISSKVVQEIDSEVWGQCSSDMPAPVASNWNTVEARSLIQRLMKVDSLLQFFSASSLTANRIKISHKNPNAYQIHGAEITLGFGLLNTSAWERIILEGALAQKDIFVKQQPMDHEILMDILMSFIGVKNEDSFYPYWSVGVYCESPQSLPRHREVCLSLQKKTLQKPLAREFQSRMQILSRLNTAYLPVESFDSLEKVFFFSQLVRKNFENYMANPILIEDRAGTEIHISSDVEKNNIIVVRNGLGHYLGNTQHFQLPDALKNNLPVKLHILKNWDEIGKAHFQFGRNVVAVGGDKINVTSIRQKDLSSFATQNPELQFVEVWKDPLNEKDLSQTVQKFVKEKKFFSANTKEIIKNRFYSMHSVIDTILSFTSFRPINRGNESL